MITNSVKRLELNNSLDNAQIIAEIEIALGQINALIDGTVRSYNEYLNIITNKYTITIIYTHTV